MSDRHLRLVPCPSCGLAIFVDPAGKPVGEHVGSRLCRELEEERKRVPVEPTP